MESPPWISKHWALSISGLASIYVTHLLHLEKLVDHWWLQSLHSYPAGCCIASGDTTTSWQHYIAVWRKSSRSALRQSLYYLSQDVILVIFLCQYLHSIEFSYKHLRAVSSVPDKLIDFSMILFPVCVIIHSVSSGAPSWPQFWYGCALQYVSDPNCDVVQQELGMCLLVPFFKRYREEITQVLNPNESEPEKEWVNIRLTCSDAEKSSRRRTKKGNSIHTSTGWGTPETDFAKTVQLWEAKAVHWVFIPHHSEAIPQQFSSSVGCLPDNWTSGPGCCVISPTSCSFIIWKVVLREPLYPPPKSKNIFHQDHSWAHIFQGPHENITSVTNNWEASYESHYHSMQCAPSAFWQ